MWFLNLYCYSDSQQMEFSLKILLVDAWTKVFKSWSWGRLFYFSAVLMNLCKLESKQIVFTYQCVRERAQKVSSLYLKCNQFLIAEWSSRSLYQGDGKWTNTYSELHSFVVRWSSCESVSEELKNVFQISNFLYLHIVFMVWEMMKEKVTNSKNK